MPNRYFCQVNNRAFKYSPRPNTPALRMEDAISDAEKARRLAVLNDRQKQIGARRNSRHVGQVLEVMVEGKNPARGQWIGRTSQIKVMNFTVPEGVELATGSYVNVRVTGSFPNSLVGEMDGGSGDRVIGSSGDLRSTARNSV